MKIVVDAMGGDNAPHAIIEGCVMALAEIPELELILTGPRDVIETELAKYDCDAARINIVDAAEVIDMAEPPVEAIRKKKDSSLVRGLRLLQAGEAGALLPRVPPARPSPGDTDCQTAAGVKRPALAPLLPTQRAKFADRPRCQLRSAAVVPGAVRADGQHLMQRMEGISAPRKWQRCGSCAGTELTKAAYDLLRTMPINFMGMPRVATSCRRL